MRGTIEVARHAGRLDDVWLWCRSPKAVLLAGRAAPQSQLAYLHDSGNLAQTLEYIKQTAALGAHMVSIHERAVSKEAVRAAQELGLVALAWALTADTHLPLLDAGVDGIVTDYPGILRKQIGPADLKTS